MAQADRDLVADGDQAAYNTALKDAGYAYRVSKADADGQRDVDWSGAEKDYTDSVEGVDPVTGAAGADLAWQQAVDAAIKDFQVAEADAYADMLIQVAILERDWKIHESDTYADAMADLAVTNGTPWAEFAAEEAAAHAEWVAEVAPAKASQQIAEANADRDYEIAVAAAEQALADAQAEAEAQRNSQVAQARFDRAQAEADAKNAAAAAGTSTDGLPGRLVPEESEEEEYPEEELEGLEYPARRWPFGPLQDQPIEMFAGSATGEGADYLESTGYGGEMEYYGPEVCEEGLEEIDIDPLVDQLAEGLVGSDSGNHIVTQGGLLTRHWSISVDPTVAECVSNDSRDDADQYGGAAHGSDGPPQYTIVGPFIFYLEGTEPPSEAFLMFDPRYRPGEKYIMIPVNPPDVRAPRKLTPDEQRVLDLAGDDEELRHRLAMMLEIIRNMEDPPKKFPDDWDPRTNEGYCHRWAQALNDKLDAFRGHGIRIEYITPKYIGPLYPYWRDHGLIKITVTVGDKEYVFYVDRHLNGGADHIAFELRDDLVDESSDAYKLFRQWRNALYDAMQRS